MFKKYEVSEEQMPIRTTAFSQTETSNKYLTIYDDITVHSHGYQTITVFVLKHHQK